MFGKRKFQYALQADVETILKASADARAIAEEAKTSADRALALAEDPQAQLNNAKAAAQAEADKRRGATGYAR
jgi:hypothetical protein